MLNQRIGDSEVPRIRIIDTEFVRKVGVGGIEAILELTHTKVRSGRLIYGRVWQYHELSAVIVWTRMASVEALIIASLVGCRDSPNDNRA